MAKILSSPKICAIFLFSVSKPGGKCVVGIESTVAERVAALFLSEELCDVVFLVGPEQLRYPANKLILAIGSSAFRDMFFGNFVEKGAAEVKLEDTDPDAFEMLLSYMYTDTVMLSNVWQVYKILEVAEKYMVPIEIFDVCKEYLICNMNTDNFYEVYRVTTRFYLDRKGGGCLVKKCWNFLIDYGNDFLQHKAFAKLSTDVIRFIISRDALKVSSEVVVFNALNNWAAQNSIRQKIEATPENKRKILGGLLDLVRFVCMPWLEFLEGPARSGILTPDEVKLISLDIASGSTESLPDGLLHEPRICTEYEIAITLSKTVNKAVKQNLETLLIMMTQDVILTQIKYLPGIDDDMMVAIINVNDECCFFNGQGRSIDVPFVYLQALNTYKIQSFAPVGKMPVGMATKNFIINEHANGRLLRIVSKAFNGRNITYDDASADADWTNLRTKINEPELTETCLELTTIIETIKFLV